MNVSHMVTASYRPALSDPWQGASPRPSLRTKSPTAIASMDTCDAPLLTIESVAFAGVDMPVHLIVTQGGSNRSSTHRKVLVLDYTAFNRLMREQAPRLAAISVLAALGAEPIVDADSGCRHWVHVHIPNVIGSALALHPSATTVSQSIQPIAA